MRKQNYELDFTHKIFVFNCVRELKVLRYVRLNRVYELSEAKNCHLRLLINVY
jgi:hypothetical protein